MSHDTTDHVHIHDVTDCAHKTLTMLTWCSILVMSWYLMLSLWLWKSVQLEVQHNTTPHVQTMCSGHVFIPHVYSVQTMCLHHRFGHIFTPKGVRPKDQVSGCLIDLPPLSSHPISTEPRVFCWQSKTMHSGLRDHQ